MTTVRAAAVEVVLPNGGFARLRVLTVGDVVEYMRIAAPFEGKAVLACRMATIDDRSIAMDELLAMAYADAAPIFSLIDRQFDVAFKTSKGIA